MAYMYSLTKKELYKNTIYMQVYKRAFENFRAFFIVHLEAERKENTGKKKDK